MILKITQNKTYTPGYLVFNFSPLVFITKGINPTVVPWEFNSSGTSTSNGSPTPPEKQEASEFSDDQLKTRSNREKVKQHTFNLPPRIP